MKILFPLIALSLLISCSNKKTTEKDPLDPNNHKDTKDTEQTDDTSWKSKDKDQALTDCKTFVAQKSNMTASQGKEFCACVLDKIQGDMTFDEFEAVYDKDKRPAENKKLQKNYDRLEEVGNECIKKLSLDQKNTDDDIKPKKHKTDDD